MKAYMKKIGGTAMVLTLVFVLAAPAMAIAVEEVPVKAEKGPMLRFDATAEPPVMAGPALLEQRKEMLKERVRDRIWVRKMRFDRATEVLADRIVRLGDIADRLDAAECDVDEARTLLVEAQELLDAALVLEAQAAEAFQAIADADDPRAAFRDARDLAVEASQTLRDARQKVSEAARLLGLCVESLCVEG